MHESKRSSNDNILRGGIYEHSPFILFVKLHFIHTHSLFFIISEVATTKTSVSHVYEYKFIEKKFLREYVINIQLQLQITSIL